MPQRSQSKNYRWNFTVNLLDGASYWFGSSFISAATIYPLFISKLTSSLLPIALVSVVISAGWFLPQLFSARITEAQLRVKKIAVGWGFFLERLPIFLLVFSGILARSHPVLALTLFFLCVLWNAIGAGVVPQHGWRWSLKYFQLKNAVPLWD
ncbi:MAG: Putative major facilitator superfamily transporter [Anaerolineaceae bacterium 46_22]|nr:MAG: Putative major facilitator superfamily transporter [Anaerolineaceae bacterium 46_22]